MIDNLKDIESIGAISIVKGHLVSSKLTAQGKELSGTIEVYSKEQVDFLLEEIKILNREIDALYDEQSGADI